MRTNKDTAIQLYIGFIIAVICNIVPVSLVQSFGLILLLVILAATYIYRAKSDKSSITYDHTSFMVKQFWVSSLILLIGMGAAWYFADHTIVYNGWNAIQRGIILTESQINSFLKDYFFANIYLFLLTLTPSVIYLSYQLIKGMICAIQDKKILA